MATDTGTRARKITSALGGGLLVECICQVKDADAVEWYEPFKHVGRDPRKMFSISEICLCGGTGWVCYSCHNAGMVLNRVGEFPKCKDTLKPCPQCATVQFGEVIRKTQHVDERECSDEVYAR